MSRADPPRVTQSSPARPRRVSRSLQARYDAVLLALRRIIRANDLQSRRLRRDCGLTTPQLVTLQTIQHLGETTIGTLSSHIALSQATLTTILDRLQEHGLVERYRSTVDRRVVHARLTSTARRVLRKAPPLLHERFLHAFAALPVTEQDRIVATLQRVATLLGVDVLEVAPLIAPGRDSGVPH